MGIRLISAKNQKKILHWGGDWLTVLTSYLASEKALAGSRVLKEIISWKMYEEGIRKDIEALVFNIHLVIAVVKFSSFSAVT